MQGSSIFLFEDGGYPLLHGKYLSQRLPAFIDALGLELLPQGLDCLAGKYRDEQVTISSILFVMVARAHSHFRFQAAKYC